MSATLNGVPFDLDPTSVQWDYTIHMTDAPYIGGKVVQIFGASISDITVDGTFGIGTWKTQLAMLERMKKLSARGIDAVGYTAYRFTWPEQGWDFEVLIRAFSSPDGSKSVVHRNEIVAPKWRLVLFPVEGSSALKEASISIYLDRLREGLGWQLTPYNGATSITEAQNALLRVGATSLSEFAQIAFGGGSLQELRTANDAIATSNITGQNFAAGAVLGVNDMLVLARNAGFAGNDISIAVAISKGESGWNSGAHNGNRSTGDDSWGLWQINMLAHGTSFGTAEELQVPERNAAAAYALYKRRGNKFTDWSVFKNGSYLTHLPEVQTAAQALGIG